MSYGSEFGEVAPKDPSHGGQINLPFIALPGSSVGADIDNQLITPITPLNSFRLGQQIIFWFGIANPATLGGRFVSRLRLKLWWLRPNLEYRAPGSATSKPALELPPSSGWAPIDRSTFGFGPVGPPFGGVSNNRYCWIPSPKRLDITPFDTSPPAPPLPPVRNSDSVLLDECLVWDLQDPTVPAYSGGFSAGDVPTGTPAQLPSRWSVLFYPAMGYALGVTADATYGAGQGPVPSVLLSCTFATGTLGGTLFQESVG